MSGREDRPEEATDTQLDALLDAAAADLLGHLKATSDTGMLLSAFLGADQSTPNSPSAASSSPAITDGQTLITIRVLARDLDRAHALAHAHAFDRDLDRCVDLARAHALALDRVRALSLALARSLVGDLAHARDRALVGALDLALDRAHDRAHNRDLAHGLAHGLDRDLVRDLARALDRAQARARDLDHGLDLDHALALVRDLDLALGLVRALDLARALAHGLAQAHPGQPWAELRELAEGPVDVSGADLTQVDVSDLTVLSNVTWSDDTLWPAGARSRIRIHSWELRPGVYLVQGEDERGNANNTFR